MDASVPDPRRHAAAREELDRLRDLLPLLKERDAERLQAFLDCDSNRKAAAEKLRVELRAYSRQLRQTVFPALRELARREGFDPFQ